MKFWPYRPALVTMSKHLVETMVTQTDLEEEATWLGRAFRLILGLLFTATSWPSLVTVRQQVEISFMNLSNKKKNDSSGRA